MTNLLTQYLQDWPGPVEAIVNVRSGDLAIGYQGRLLQSCKSKTDWQCFKQHSHKADVLLMGRRTAQSICTGWSVDSPSQPVLQGRHTIVASAGQLYNLPEQPGQGTLLICGGSEIYKQSLKYCAAVHVTFTMPEYIEPADSHFDVDLLGNYFVEDCCSSIGNCQFVTHVNKARL